MTTFITCFLVLYWNNNWITWLCKILGLFLSISISTILYSIALLFLRSYVRQNRDFNDPI